MTTDTREIHVGWVTSDEFPDTYQAYAECADEITKFVLMNPTPDIAAMFLIPVEEVGTSAAYRGLVDDHLARCSACRAWEAGSNRAARRRQRRHPESGE